MNIEAEDVLALRLAEQTLLADALKAKTDRLQELESEVRYLREILNSAFAAPRAALATTQEPKVLRRADIPLRWKLR